MSIELVDCELMNVRSMRWRQLSSTSPKEADAVRAIMLRIQDVMAERLAGIRVAGRETGVRSGDLNASNGLQPQWDFHLNEYKVLFTPFIFIQSWMNTKGDVRIYLRTQSGALALRHSSAHTQHYHMMLNISTRCPLSGFSFVSDTEIPLVKLCRQERDSF